MSRSLGEWLAHAGRLHPRAIDLGLDRVAQVARLLGMRAAAPVITVGGTNGKGSTCAMLERVLRCAGYRTGLYTSPHLLAYNERVRICGEPAADAVLCSAFEVVEAARGEVPLTYFEFGTLVAMQAFAAASPEVLILEVGLGGRLDAVNLFDPDCAVLAAIDLDHAEYLGATRDAVGREKAGILRAGRPAILGDPDPPASLIAHGEAIGAGMLRLGVDFGYLADRGQWQYWSRRDGGIRRRSGLAHPALRGRHQLANAATAIAALEAVELRLPVAMQDIRRGLAEVEWPGRFQVVPGRPLLVLDVAHNPQAAAALAESLGEMGFHPQTWAVFGMMKDKDVRGVVERMKARVDCWLAATLPPPRGARAEELEAVLTRFGVGDVKRFASPALALAHARGQAGRDDRIVAFGSFVTVADVMRAAGA
ncbi:MAG: bifunctional folylpolyglutamate synthase/dihydrofolate synthase [Betaproteobacteria bacterium CG2_30_68_42]|nr:MAG: bifunctional folylpolyglutamate synthase/dihydrofolate synthase [Betaproteobacteria bacterium CG2_30_68_42]PIX75021.1 MAG: bifunctional tetrahydrofolate synthase/dihydrofolate synthase [Rhodocyclales bacterium CG_4_10_14_3_um_filter_68_10]